VAADEVVGEDQLEEAVDMLVCNATVSDTDLDTFAAR
jgi:hypothetical protein